MKATGMIALTRDELLDLVTDSIVRALRAERLRETSPAGAPPQRPRSIGAEAMSLGAQQVARLLRRRDREREHAQVIRTRPISPLTLAADALREAQG